MKNCVFIILVFSVLAIIIGCEEKIVYVETQDNTSKVLNEDMTLTQMLQCTSGDIEITIGQYESLKSMVNWVVGFSHPSGESSASAWLSAYDKYLEMIHRTGGGYLLVGGVTFNNGETTGYRYYR